MTEPLYGMIQGASTIRTLQNETLALVLHAIDRLSGPLLSQYLKDFPCVALLGVRQCGKTTLLKQLLDTRRHFDLERRADYAVVANDPDTFLRLNPRQVAIDEAQLLPELFSALRVAIDDHRSENGRFVVTGSSSPALIRSLSESLAGRVAIIEMAPFAWAEVTETIGAERKILTAPTPAPAHRGNPRTSRPLPASQTRGPRWWDHHDSARPETPAPIATSTHAPAARPHAHHV